jgi:hypothetical protein
MAKFYYQTETEKYLFLCPGCNCLHFAGKGWTFNGDLEKPTVSPSIVVKLSKNQICHSFIHLGQIEFLPDSWHKLKGQTVEIPEWT